MASPFLVSKPTSQFQVSNSITTIFRQPLHQRYVNHVSPLIEIFLGESGPQARKIARRAYKETLASTQIWEAMAQETLEQAISKSNQIAARDCQCISSFFAHRKGGVLLTTIHMGDFLHAILQLAEIMGRDEIFIVRQKKPDDVEARVFAKLDGIGVRAKAIRSYETSAAIKVMRALTEGAIVVILFDLPESYGAGTSVRFFAHELSWVSAPSLLAKRTRSILVPFVSYRTPSGFFQCDVLEVHDFSVESAANCDTNGLAQKLANIAEQYVQRFPEQWLQWPLIPEMLAQLKPVED